MKLGLDEHCVAESKEDFSRWEVLHVEDFKPGVKRVHVRSSNKAPAEFRMVYAAEEHVPTEFRLVAR